MITSFLCIAMQLPGRTDFPATSGGMSTSFFKGNPSDGRNKLVTIEVQGGGAERVINMSPKLPPDFTRVWGCVSSTQHTPTGVLDREFNALRKKGETRQGGDRQDQKGAGSQKATWTGQRAGGDHRAAGSAAPARLNLGSPRPAFHAEASSRESTDSREERAGA